jgi:hypothetical protein
MPNRKIVALEDFGKEIREWSHASLKKKQECVAKGLARSIPMLVAKSPVDTGLYAASWDFKIEEKKAILGNYAPYAGIIEYGARPFTPPIQPLLAWAKRVLSGSTDAQGKAIETGQPETGYGPEVWALAKYTQKKISERGMEPRHVLENAIPDIIRNIQDEMRKIV